MSFINTQLHHISSEAHQPCVYRSRCFAANNLERLKRRPSSASLGARLLHIFRPELRLVIQWLDVFWPARCVPCGSRVPGTKRRRCFYSVDLHDTLTPPYTYTLLPVLGFLHPASKDPCTQSDQWSILPLTRAIETNRTIVYRYNAELFEWNQYVWSDVISTLPSV